MVEKKQQQKVPYPGIREIRAVTGNLVPCLSGVVGDIRQGKVSRVRKSGNHLLSLKVKSFAAVLKCGGILGSSERTAQVAGPIW